jgi:hypothetical protein
MKTSNILLTCLLAVTLLFIVGSNLVLKAEFDKIDRKDAFYGYKQETVKPFKYVKLQGKQIGITQIQPGTSYEIRFNKDRKLFDWKVIGDTLEMTYKRTWNEQPNQHDKLNYKPVVYILAPQISGVTTEKTTSIVKGWKNQNMIIKQSGNVMLLTDNTIHDLSALLTQGGNMKIDSNNRIENSITEVKDSSSFSTDKNIFKSFQAHVDSTGHISLPGDLYRKTLK